MSIYPIRLSRNGYLNWTLRHFLFSNLNTQLAFTPTQQSRYQAILLATFLHRPWQFATPWTLLGSIQRRTIHISTLCFQILTHPFYARSLHLSIFLIQMASHLLSGVVFFILLHFCVALSLNGSSSYIASVVTPCPTNDPCCAPAPCTIQFDFDGTWLSKTDSPSTEDECRNTCAQQFDTCKKGCDDLFSTREIQSNQCKCKLPPPGLFDFDKGDCLLRCEDARHTCVTVCESSECLVAFTQIKKFSKEVVGKCERLACPKSKVNTCSSKWYCFSIRKAFPFQRWHLFSRIELEFVSF